MNKSSVFVSLWRWEYLTEWRSFHCRSTDVHWTIHLKFDLSEAHLLPNTDVMAKCFFFDPFRLRTCCSRSRFVYRKACSHQELCWATIHERKELRCYEFSTLVFLQVLLKRTRALRIETLKNVWSPRETWNRVSSSVLHKEDRQRSIKCVRRQRVSLAVRYKNNDNRNNMKFKRIAHTKAYSTQMQWRVRSQTDT